MEQTISGDNPGTSVVDNPATGHTPEPNGTPQSNGQPDGQTGHVDDLFKGIDPNKLPPELRPHLDNMVRIYREKSEKLSETVKSETAKAVEAYRQKADLYEQIAAREDFVQQWNEYVQKQTASQAQQEQVPSQVEQKLQEMELKFQQKEAAEVVDAFSNATDDKGQKLYPDFEKLNQIVVGNSEASGAFSLLRAGVELATGSNYQEKLLNGYKSAKQAYDIIFEEGKKAGMGRVQDKARNGSLPPSSLSAGSSASRLPKNAMEALQFAKQGLAVHRE